MTTPDVPKSFLVALATAILAVAAAFGLPISDAQSDAILQLAEILSPAIAVAGAWLHVTRAKNADGVLKAKAVQAASEVVQSKTDAAKLDEKRAPSAEDQAAYGDG